MWNAAVSGGCCGSSLPRVLTRLGNSSGREYKCRPDAPAKSGRLWIRPIGEEQIEKLHISEFGYRRATTLRNGESL